MWAIYALVSALFASLVAIFGKIGLESIDSTLATTVRAVIMAVFLLLVASMLGKSSGFSLESLGTRAWGYIALSGIAGALSWLFYFFAIKQGMVSGVVALDKLSIVFAVLLAALLFGETVGAKGIIGSLLMVAGAIMIAL